MCLDVNSKRKIAKRDIKCYTLAEILDDIPVTYYQYVSIKAKMTSKLICRASCTRGLIVEVGLHSFKYKKDAEQRRSYDHEGNTIILSWIIPKGASYYEGTFRTYNMYPSYASNKRNLVNPEILKKWTKPKE